MSVLGPSGCGKSTLLRLVGSLEQPTAGIVTVNGEPPGRVSAAHALGVAFQDHALLPWLSVHDNIALPFRIAGRAVDEPAITRLIELVGLTSFETARHLSMHGIGQLADARAQINIGTHDIGGNYPLSMTVRGLPRLPRGGWYELLLSKHGRPTLSGSPSSPATCRSTTTPTDARSHPLPSSAASVSYPTCASFPAPGEAATSSS